MNLQTAPNLNIQNNKQNPNFGMIKCNDEVLVALRKKGGKVVKNYVVPFDVSRSLPLGTDIYWSKSDRVAQELATDKGAIWGELAHNAVLITLDDVNKRWWSVATLLGL